MNIKKQTLFISIIALSTLSACSSIKEMFPDKEKNYQLETQIPKLVIPADLTKGNTLPATASASPNTNPTSASDSKEDRAAESVEEKAAASSDTNASSLNDPTIDPASVNVELLAASNNINYLRLNVAFASAWRLVSKGLIRKSIEVTDRNQADRTFTVQYDPEEKSIEDGSYMDELNFILNGFQSNEKEYVLKLVETNQHTDVVVLTDEQKPVSDEGSSKLLQVLRYSIKHNLAGK